MAVFANEMQPRDDAMKVEICLRETINTNGIVWRGAMMKARQTQPAPTPRLSPGVHCEVTDGMKRRQHGQESLFALQKDLKSRHHTL